MLSGTTSTSPTDDNSHQYCMKFEFDTKDENSFHVVDRGLYDSVHDIWKNISSTSPLLCLHQAGASGSLVLLNDKTNERLSVAAGIYDEKVWSDILTDLPQEATADGITKSYYGPRRGRLSDSANRVETTSSLGTCISLVVSMMWDGSYAVKVTIDNTGVQV